MFLSLDLFIADSFILELLDLSFYIFKKYLVQIVKFLLEIMFFEKLFLK